MKKFVSIILSIALVLSLFCVSVSAADVTAENTKTDVVGTLNSSTANDVSEGATSPAGTSSANISLEIKSDVGHRYAVEVEFSNLTYEINAALTWNVNTHKYEGPENNTTPLTSSITVTNHSDMPVKKTITCTLDSAVGSTISTPTISDAEKNIVACPIGQNPTGDVSTLTISPATNWLEVINTALPTGGATEIKIATVTVTIGAADSTT